MVVMRIDAHQHFWDYENNPGDFPWIGNDNVALRGRFGPAELKPLLQQSGIDGCVAVQARASLRETDYLLGHAARHPFILGVVGWVDLSSADADRYIASYARDTLFKGVRLEIPDGPFPADSPRYLRGARALGALEKTIDILLAPHQLRSVSQLADMLPNQPIVINHLAKPIIGKGTADPWWGELRELAERPNVFCKLSSIITQQRSGSWRAATIAPYLDHAIDCFGSRRLMFGSDWPVCVVAADYATTIGLFVRWAQELSGDERDDILGKTCQAFYQL